MKLPVIVGSNMYNEIQQVEGWLKNVREFADGIFIVDTGSTDGTIEFFKKEGVEVIVDDIIIREGYGPARNNLRSTALSLYPNAHWLLFMDADERIDPEDYHQIRFLADNLSTKFNCIALPRLDWHDLEKTKSENDIHVHADYQARMTRLNSNISYVRKIHEQVINANIYCKTNNPVLNHFHRPTDQKTRDYVGRVCSKLHAEDKEFGHTYPKHHKEDYYAKQVQEGGLQ